MKNTLHFILNAGTFMVVTHTTHTTHLTTCRCAFVLCWIASVVRTQQTFDLNFLLKKWKKLQEFKPGEQDGLWTITRCHMLLFFPSDGRAH